MQGNLRQNETLYFLPPPPDQKNVPAPLTIPITDVLRRYAFAAVFHFFVSERRVYPRYETTGCERKDKNFYVIKFCPPNFFESFAPLVLWLNNARFSMRSLSLLIVVNGYMPIVCCTVEVKLPELFR